MQDAVARILNEGVPEIGQRNASKFGFMPRLVVTTASMTPSTNRWTSRDSVFQGFVNQSWLPRGAAPPLAGFVVQHAVRVSHVMIIAVSYSRH
jgi:hypothetical protein